MLTVDFLISRIFPITSSERNSHDFPIARRWRFGQSLAARHEFLQGPAFVGPAIGRQHRIPGSGRGGPARPVRTVKVGDLQNEINMDDDDDDDDNDDDDDRSSRCFLISG